MSNLSDLMAQNERDARLRDLLDQTAGGNYGSQTYIPQPYVTGPIGAGDNSDRGFGYTPMDQTASGGDVGPAAPPYVTGPIGVGDDSDRGFGQLQRTPNSSQGDVRRADLANVRAALAGIYGPVPNNWRSDQSQAGVIPDRSAPPQQPVPQQPAERPELVPNQFRNERTGVVTTLSPPPPDRQTQPQSNNGVTILDSQQQRDGSLLQLVSFPGVDGFGRQTMKKEIRRVIPDELNPQVKARQEMDRRALELEQTRAQIEAARNPAPHYVTNDDGSVTAISRDGRMRTIPGVGRRAPALIKAEAAQKKLSSDMAEAIRELETATADNGLLDQSTGSGIGTAVDAVAGAFGVGTKGAIAVGKMAPIYDLVLKMVPRFEGPQSDKDTESYKNAAGQLANPAVPNSVKKEAGKEILRLMKARQGQFTDKNLVGTEYDALRSGAAAAAPPAGAPVPVRSEAEARQLPSGTLFVGPDGVQRRVR